MSILRHFKTVDSAVAYMYDQHVGFEPINWIVICDERVVVNLEDAVIGGDSIERIRKLRSLLYLAL